MPQVDLVIVFRASPTSSVRKEQELEDARKAEEQYARLIKTLSSAGLRAVGRSGESLGHLLVFVSCPKTRVHALIKRERHSDFLSGLPTIPMQSQEQAQPLSPADHTRLVHAFITSTTADGGLGISPDSAESEWDLVESVMALHDRKFNEHWIHTWTTSRHISVKQEHLREQFGDSVALYFLFLHCYTRALVFPAVLGVLFFFLGSPYSPTYSILIVFWSVVFVEWWRGYERILSLRFGNRGSFRVERRRAQYIEGFPWWKQELRMVASLPVIVFFAGALVLILTGIFVLEAFVTQLYTGPGHTYISFSPTVLFVALVPQLLAFYQRIAIRLTDWENHAHQSSHAASLTLKTFALSALVAYLGLALSAFVYVPFGEVLMRAVQVRLFKGSASAGSVSLLNSTELGQKLDSARLTDQLIAYTVMDQVVDTFNEIGLPYILRAFHSFRTRWRSTGTGHREKVKKRMSVFEEKEEQKERSFLKEVRKQVALPEYETLDDYSEMVTQFGYVVLWSAIWPLAPAMALVNNFFELRSDAFKITVHNRRPIPARTETIGPWLEALTSLTWLAALANAALVYLFCPRANSPTVTPSVLDRVRQHIVSAASAGAVPDDGRAAGRELLGTALLIALAASHGYILVRVVVRHVMEKALWHASGEERARELAEREVKARFLTELLGTTDVDVDGCSVDSAGVEVDEQCEDVEAVAAEGLRGFWDHDEGMQEIQRITKNA
ncbi:calcium-activated chloride channel-domain-containing protein [Mycena maculata]|uniref:Calcium-activated chloride channel-domain-containing protein n=1 Tax=Mycena maculata TaxID=230809 RepID=A0AAD7J2T7_9AGAR|nr:calcium-activated chloride channel-domain-containing protein [Mycena maculata]